MPTYDYSCEASSGRSVAYVDYNISLNVDSAALNRRIGIDTEVTITGTAFSKNFAIKSIGVYCVLIHASPDYYKDSGYVAYKNKTIAKNATGTFEIKFTFTETLWEYFKNYFEEEDSTIESVLFKCIGFALNRTAMSSSEIMPTGNKVSYGVFVEKLGTAMDIPVYITTPDTATIIDFTVEDIAPGDPLGVFGNLTQGQSLPRLTLTWSADPNHPAMKYTHDIMITTRPSSQSVPRQTIGRYSITETASGATTAYIDTDRITYVGNIAIDWDITDIHNSMSGSNTTQELTTVVAYEPPSITTYLLERYRIIQTAGDPTYEAADDGEHVWFTLTADIQPVNNSNAWTAVMTYWDASLGESSAITVTSQDGWTLGGSDGTTEVLTRDRLQLNGIQVNNTKDYNFRLTITDAIGNSVSYVNTDIVKAGAVFDISQYGVAVGMRSTGGSLNKKFEVASDHTAVFNGDVIVPTNNLLKVVTASGSVTVSSSATKTLTVTPGAGWTPIAIVGFESSQTYCPPYKIRLVNGDVEMSIRYYGSSSSQTVTLTADVLCLHTSIS